MGRCDYFEKECNNNSKCNECLNHRKPDMREKVKEYISELKEEIRRCDAKIEKLSYDEFSSKQNRDKIKIYESRAIVLTEVRNDLKSRLEELV